EFKKGNLSLAQLLQVDAKQAAALLMLGHTLYEQGRYQESKNLFEGLLVLDPGNPYLFGILGSIYQKEGSYPVAINLYTQALDLFPGDIDSRVNRGEVYLKLGKLREAAADFQESIAIDPSASDP